MFFQISVAFPSSPPIPSIFLFFLFRVSMPPMTMSARVDVLHGCMVHFHLSLSRMVMMVRVRGFRILLSNPKEFSEEALAFRGLVGARATMFWSRILTGRMMEDIVSVNGGNNVWSCRRTLQNIWKQSIRSLNMWRREILVGKCKKAIKTRNKIKKKLTMTLISCPTGGTTAHPPRPWLMGTNTGWFVGCTTVAVDPAIGCATAAPVAWWTWGDVGFAYRDL